jgi:glycosyltransferase involved in cell wall biosynthesis
VAGTATVAKQGAAGVRRDTTVTVGIPTYNRAELLRETLESVLAQTYPNFRLLITDNASTDETAKTVAAYPDSRIDYIRNEHNIGMIANFNRLIDLTQTDFLMLLPDDDLLYPDYLRSVIEILEQNPRAGLVHTAFDEIDIGSRVRKQGTTFVKSSQPWLVEPGHAFLERGITSIAICQSSATFRTRALREAGGMTASDGAFADIPLFLRIALNWDVAYLNQPLVAFRVHQETETLRLALEGQDEADARDRLLASEQIIFDLRMGFLDGAGLPNADTARYRALATLRFLADRSGLGAPWMRTWTEFGQIVSNYPQILIHPMAWRFIAAQLGGRAMRRSFHRLRRV